MNGAEGGGVPTLMFLYPKMLSPQVVGLMGYWRVR